MPLMQLVLDFFAAPPLPVLPDPTVGAEKNKPEVPPAQAGIAPVAIEKIAGAVPAAGSPATDPYAYADSAEHREGIAAFLAKRPPVF